MANYQNIFARFQHKYDTWANWSNTSEAGKGGNLVLLKGELGICEIPGSTGQVANEPVVLFKIGDGVKTFANLPWGSAKAADVYDWAKKTPAQFIEWLAGQNVIDGKTIKAYIDGEVATALQSAKDYADGLAGNYDVAGAAATAETNTKAYTDTEVQKANDAAAAAKTQADKGVADAATAQQAALTAQTKADNAASAASAADGRAVAAQNDVDALEEYVGTFTHDTAKTVVEYINAKTDGIATSGNLEALGNRVTGVETRIKAVEDDYLQEADKTELIGLINGKADQTALDDVSAVANAAATKNYVDTELGKKLNVSVYNEDKATFATKTELNGVAATAQQGVDDAANALAAAQAAQADINAFMGTFEAGGDATDTLQEVLDLIAAEDNEVATTLLAEVNQLKAADVTLQANIDNKADKTVVNDIDTRLEAVESKVDVTTDVSTAITNAVDALKTNEVAANTEAINVEVSRAKAAEAGLGDRITELEKYEHSTYATKSDLSTARTEISAEIDADVKALADGAVAINAGNISANATAISNLQKNKIETLSAGTGLKAAQTTSGNNTAWTISLDEAVVFVFNGGSSTTNVNTPAELGQ